jgi:uracil-DNA glycosylase
MLNIEQLIAQIQQEAQSATFPIDEPVYQAAGLSPTQPILYAGNLNSNLCIFARDLGKDEVQARQPLYGAAGKLVRQGLYRAIYGQAANRDTDLQIVCDRVLLTNTVPYKPTGNKAYSEAVKKRFRPFIEQLLLHYWQGDKIITLGNEAFHWFAPYSNKGALKEFFESSDRYHKSIQITLESKDSDGNQHQRLISLMPLPHPSPLNQKYYAQFPQLLQQRLAEISL